MTIMVGSNDRRHDSKGVAESLHLIHEFRGDSEKLGMNAVGIGNPKAKR